MISIFVVLGMSSGCAHLGLGAIDESYQKPQYHIVSSGDTAATIAARYGVSQRTVELLNGIRSFTKLYPGEKVIIAYGALPNGYFQSGKVGGRRGVSQSNNKLSWPLHVGRVTSRFGRRWGTFHKGIDIAASTGTPVYAAHDGVVVYSGNGLSGYGNLIVIRASSGLTTIYAHNSRLILRKGHRVWRGQKVSEVGATGRATGPHLHFEVRLKRGVNKYQAVDPLPYLQ